MKFQKALPIWSKITEDVNQYALFRRKFALSRLPESATLYLRVDQRFEVRLNGVTFEEQQYSDYDFCRTFEQIDLSRALRVGENELTVLGYCTNRDSSSYRAGSPSLIYELVADGKILIASDGDTEVTDDTGFLSGPVEVFSTQLLYSFRYDAENAASPVWRPATVLGGIPDMEYEPRPIPTLQIAEPADSTLIAEGTFVKADFEKSGERMMNATLKDAAVSDGKTRTFPAKDGIFFSSPADDGIFFRVDLGQETVGFLLFDIDTPEPCDIDGGFGEHLADGRVRSWVGHRNFAFHIRTRAGRNRVWWPIKRLGCRYLDFHVSSHAFRVYYAGVRPVNYPVKEIRVPKGLNERQRKIYDVSVRTLLCCMHEHYEDCPWREQALYTMDSSNQMRFGYDAFGETRMPRASLRLLAQGQKENGLLELCAPARVVVTIPSFALIYLRELEEYVEQTNDLDFLREMFPYTVRIMNYFSFTDDGLVVQPKGEWNFYEWNKHLDYYISKESKADREAHLDAPIQAFYAIAARCFLRLEKKLGNQPAIPDLEERLARMKTAYRKTFYDESVRAYRAATTEECYNYFPALVQTMTIVSGLYADEAEKSDLLCRLIDKEFQPDITLSHRFFLYEALLSEGDRFRDRVLADVEEHWGMMLDAGATTFWETELGEADFDRAGSLCHGWSAVPIWVYNRLFAK